MKNEFIPYEQSLELKELGFDEECLFCFYGKSDLSNFKESDYELCGDRHNSSFKEDGRVSAPLYQQVFRWFKENYNLKDDYGVFPHHTIMSNYVLNGGNEENAEVECTKELISIVKNKYK